jgi:hypothetical protein
VLELLAYWKENPPVHILVGNFFEKEKGGKIPSESELDEAVNKFNRG